MNVRKEIFDSFVGRKFLLGTEIVSYEKKSMNKKDNEFVTS
jgi:hypothetical protein